MCLSLCFVCFYHSLFISFCLFFSHSLFLFVCFFLIFCLFQPTFFSFSASLSLCLYRYSCLCVCLLFCLYLSLSSSVPLFLSIPPTLLPLYFTIPLMLTLTYSPLLSLPLSLSFVNDKFMNESFWGKQNDAGLRSTQRSI